MAEMIYDVKMTKEEKDAVYDAIDTVLDLEEKIVASDDEWDYEGGAEERERSRRYHVVLRGLLERL